MEHLAELDDPAARQADDPLAYAVLTRKRDRLPTHKRRPIIVQTAISSPYRE